MQGADSQIHIFPFRVKLPTNSSRIFDLIL